MRVDLNADMGESFGSWVKGNDEALLDIISSANIACGSVSYTHLTLPTNRSCLCRGGPGQ